MRTILTTVSELCDAVQLDFHEPPAIATDAPGRHRFRNLIAAWDNRAYCRWQLARMARETPQLIDDIGLTMAEVNAEIAKPFWRR
ncbi:DUF1127 domain-containing protein [Mesorhizobium sp. M0871]|uniref:DUF1127 domain-containing protein n=1 Tax=Mesorhizobium sp. M0871 TaxID=2957017 RepID=UPI0033386A48